MQTWQRIGGEVAQPRRGEGQRAGLSVADARGPLGDRRFRCKSVQDTFLSDGEGGSFASEPEFNGSLAHVETLCEFRLGQFQGVFALGKRLVEGFGHH